jgi:hypothetical protein
MPSPNASNVRIAWLFSGGIGIVVQPGKNPPEAIEIMILSRSNVLPFPGFSAKLRFGQIFFAYNVSVVRVFGTYGGLN